MLPKTQREEIIALINREVVPAIGCTEPIAVALCVAKATEMLGTLPQQINVGLSSNVLKNAMGVGIPGTGMIGLPIAIALGALIGKSEYQLEVLKDVTNDAVEKGKRYIDKGAIKISHIKETPSKLHIEVTVSADGNTAKAVISVLHTNFIHLSKNGEILLEKAIEDESTEESGHDCSLNLATVWEFATETPLDELEFILESKRLNKAAATKSFEGEYGHSLGITIRDHGKILFGDTPLRQMLSYTTAASDARMAGATFPVMSNSGSGNQGITATMPVVSYAEYINASEEEMIRALTLSHLATIYIKQSLGRLSALCGVVIASTGVACALVYLMGGKYNEVCSAVKNMIANLTGMLCDGAKPSCAMKITSGISAAMTSALLAMNDRCVTYTEGIVATDVDQSIRNMTAIGRDAMNETDNLVLKIMTSK